LPRCEFFHYFFNLHAQVIALRIAYVALFITLALMTWAFQVESAAQRSGSLLPMGSSVLDDDPPCFFNPLCTCSNPGPTDLGIVACHDVPFGNLPTTFNNTKIFFLSLVGNKLGVLQGQRLVGSGKWNF